MTLEMRAFTIEDLRMEDGEQPTISGYAAVFNQRSLDLGGFVEEIAPGAFANLEDDIRSLWNHNADFPLGRTTAGTLALRVDEVGLRFTLTPPNTQYARDLLVSMRRGDVNQMSFGFRTVRDSWETLDERTELRRLLQLRLREVSPVTFPAYPQTSAMVRSMRGDDPAAVPELLRSEHLVGLGQPIQTIGYPQEPGHVPGPFRQPVDPTGLPEERPLGTRTLRRDLCQWRALRRVSRAMGSGSGTTNTWPMPLPLVAQATPCRSSRRTESPRRATCKATAQPMIPAPATTTSALWGTSGVRGASTAPLAAPLAPVVRTELPQLRLQTLDAGPFVLADVTGLVHPQLPHGPEFAGGPLHLQEVPHPVVPDPARRGTTAGFT